MNKKILAVALGLGLFPGMSFATETELRGAIKGLVGELVQQGVLPKEKAEEIVERAMERANSETATAAGSKAPAKEPAGPAEGSEPKASELPANSIRVPYIPEPVKQEIIEQIRPSVRQDVVQDILKQAKEERWGMPDAFPAWVNRIAWFGDLRLRYQKDYFADTNAGNRSSLFYRDIQRINDRRSGPASVDDFLNTSENRDTLRLRLRLGMLAKITDEIDVGVRIASGNTGNPVSTNQTFGNSYRPGQLVLDQAFLRYQSADKAMTLWGGRMPNPFLTTELVWSDNLNFDGVAGIIHPLSMGASASPSAGFSPFLTLGAFPLQEVERSRNDKWLYATQLGFDWKFGKSKLSVATSYYRFSHIAGQLNEPGSSVLDYTAPQFVQKGNTLYLINDPADPTRPLYGLASDFKERDLIASLDIGALGTTHVILTAHYVKNIGYDQKTVLNRTNGDVYISPLEKDTTGSHLKLTVGSPKLQNKGDWQTTWAYRRVGRDAVIDAFTDSDFHLGGTDARGWILGGGYAFANNTSATLRYLTSDAIKGPPLSIDTWQLDINVRF